ncbi:MAG: hypothetical protein QG639_976 [Patescibacteria group bacterium]|nr:hypothetical protein [Patescibacteria group bacterium]
MNQAQALKSPAKQTNNGSINPFARALAETEKTNDFQNGGQGLDAFREALAKSRSGKSFNFPQDGSSQAPSEDMLKQQQEEMRREQEKAALRKRLHDRVNPVDNQALFDARDKQVKDQINQIRQELKMLSVEVKSLNKDVELTLMTKIADPGEKGAYYLAFFDQLRSLIVLLRKNVKSASTWLQSHRGKQKKGMQIKGKSYQKTSTVQNMMHHERSSSYAGA